LPDDPERDAPDEPLGEEPLEDPPLDPEDTVPASSSIGVEPLVLPLESSPELLVVSASPSPNAFWDLLLQAARATCPTAHTSTTDLSEI